MKLGIRKDDARKIIMDAVRPYAGPYGEPKVVFPARTPRGWSTGFAGVGLVLQIFMMIWEAIRRWPSSQWFAATEGSVICLDARGTKPGKLRFSLPPARIRIEKWETGDTKLGPVSITLRPEGGRRVIVTVSGEWKAEAERFRELLTT